MKRLLSLLCLMGIMFAFQTRLYGMDVSFQLVVVNGTADKVGMMVQAYQTVTITANSYADKVFSQWVCNDNVELADATAAQTTFIMPLFPVTVIAMYKPTVTVVDGVADKAAAAEGETVTITADEPAEDEVFDKWVGDGVEFEDANAVQTSFVMPAAAVTVRATYKAKIPAPLYMVVYDLDKTEWKIRYTDEDPDLDDDACRTTELWLRYIPAGTFTMGSPEDELGHKWLFNEPLHKVTLTKPFYIGVFECTQRQWELVMGGRPSYFNNNDYYATRPVEQIRYDMVRGASAGTGWPENGHAVDETSFMGVLRDKTGLMFDLPTEAQWEYACRAGTETALNSGKNLENAIEDANMAEVGRYYYNSFSPSQGGYTLEGTAKVGSYLPNTWGLYDMHGNVWEWCLDLFDVVTQSSADDATDPVGNATGRYHVLRGGGCLSSARLCRSASRYFYEQSYNDYKNIGFRIICLPPYAVTVVNGTADKAEAAEGETVTITANMPASGQTFDKWTGDVEFANETAVETTFEMPANAVTVTATYKALPAVKTYKIVVVNGTADKAKAAAGETVTLTAKPAPAGKVFDKWTGRGVAFENAAAPVTTFEMPANNVTVTATFKKLPSVKTYKIVVVNGKADKAKAVAGETVTLTANPPPAGKVFDRWTGGAAFDDPNAAETTFVMPAKAVTPKALYKRK